MYMRFFRIFLTCYLTLSKYFIDYSVLANTTYYYKISANNSQYGESNFSIEISIYVPALLLRQQLLPQILNLVLL